MFWHGETVHQLLLKPASGTKAENMVLSHALLKARSRSLRRAIQCHTVVLDDFPFDVSGILAIGFQSEGDSI